MSECNGGKAFLEIRIDRICAEDVLRSFLFLVSRFDNRLVLWPFSFSVSLCLSGVLSSSLSMEKKRVLLQCTIPLTTSFDLYVCVCVPFSGNVEMCCVVLSLLLIIVVVVVLSFELLSISSLCFSIS